MANYRSAWSVSRSARLRWGPGQDPVGRRPATRSPRSAHRKCSGRLHQRAVHSHGHRRAGSTWPARWCDVRRGDGGRRWLCRTAARTALADSLQLRSTDVRGARRRRSGRSTSRTARCGSSARRRRRRGCHQARWSCYEARSNAWSWALVPNATSSSPTPRAASAGGWVTSWACRRIARISTPGAISCPTWRTVLPTSGDPSRS